MSDLEVTENLHDHAPVHDWGEQANSGGVRGVMHTGIRPTRLG
jgi:hypothetical protein